MNRVILFSPVGGTDPISLSNYKDGSMLHICRVYHPTDVYLYMSKEILELHNSDNRYLYCLDKLAEMDGFKMEYTIIGRESLGDVQRFDFFYDEFSGILNDIVEKMDDTDKLLLNVSSGTPAMKSGLLVLATMGDIDCQCIQVITPNRNMNTHIHKGYDVKILWEADEDNVADFENRCEEVKCPSLMSIRQEGNIKKYLDSYDYQAALDLAQSLPASRTHNYLELIKMAKYRLQLDYRAARTIEKEQSANVFPIKNDEWIRDFEFALQLDIKRKREEYGDFLRAMTPLIADLYEKILKARYQINIDDYCSVQMYDHVRKWDENKLGSSENQEILNTLKGKYGIFRYGPVYSDNLYQLIEHYSSTAMDSYSCVRNLRNIEKTVRNIAAHEMTMMNDEKIKSRTGFTSGEAMEMIKECFQIAQAPLVPGCWNSYDEMNELIKSKMQ